MGYILFLVSFLIFGGIIYYVNKNKPEKKTLIVERVLIFVAIGLFVIRFGSYFDVQVDGEWFDYQYLGPGKGLVKIHNLLGELCLWLIVSANLFLFMRPFAESRTSKWFVKFMSTPIILASVIFMYPMLDMMIGEHHYVFGQMQFVEYALPLELGATLALSIYFLIKDWNEKIVKEDKAEVIIMSTVGHLFTAPPFLFNFFFGKGSTTLHAISFNLTHRMTMYILLIIIPLGLYFWLRNKEDSKIRYLLIFISLGVMFNFCYFNKYDVIVNPWDLPLHLCNTAVFIVPICLIFKPKRLFYFTYFINVFGALLAILMPNYDKTATIFQPSVVRFWYNHALACMMPLLCVALHQFERPKLKQYFYSTIWFTVYFLLMLNLNAFFTAIGHRTDFFFINFTEEGTNYVAEKAGTWAENLFKGGVLVIEIGDLDLIFHPLFQAIFYVGYFLIGFAMWFVYQLGFDISDAHYDLYLRLKKIRLDKFAAQSVLQGRSFSEPMDKNAGISLKLDHFSKKYGNNKHYSVHDANLEVKGGEVFGFLGPNGAGKSTIIKSIVGIQPITEGNISICGYDVNIQSVECKSRIGFVPDHYALYEKLTGREYLNYIADIYLVDKKVRDERLAEYIKLFELEGSIDNKIKTYSHGMKQKITIIAALVHDPKVWILDEPLTGLDPTSIYQVKQCMLNHAKKGNIVFFSSHLIDIVEKLCQRIAIIKKGQIQCVKTCSEIEKSGTTLEQFYLDTIGDKVTKAK